HRRCEHPVRRVSDHHPGAAPAPQRRRPAPDPDRDPRREGYRARSIGGAGRRAGLDGGSGSGSDSRTPAAVNRAVSSVLPFAGGGFGGALPRSCSRRLMPRTIPSVTPWSTSRTSVITVSPTTRYSTSTSFDITSPPEGARTSALAKSVPRARVRSVRPG